MSGKGSTAEVGFSWQLVFRALKGTNGGSNTSTAALLLLSQTSIFTSFLGRIIVYTQENGMLTYRPDMQLLIISGGSHATFSSMLHL